jgi:lipoate-protein ligase A
MRQPRQTTPTEYPLREPPRAAIAADEALLEAVAADGRPQLRCYVVCSPALVLGLGLRTRRAEIVDTAACQMAGVEVIERRAGGGVVLLNDGMLCFTVCIPASRAVADLTESYRWLGEHFAARIPQSHRVEIAEARADVAELKQRWVDPVARLLLTTCYGALSPHEVAVGAAKVVGLAQVRRQHAALFQIGVLLRDQSGLADFLRVPDQPTRESFRAALHQRSTGLADLLRPLPHLPELARSLSPTLD